MQLLFFNPKFLSFVAFIMPPLIAFSQIFLVVAVIYDIVKRKFYWTKRALLAFGLVVIFLLAYINMLYNTVGSIGGEK